MKTIKIILVSATFIFSTAAGAQDTGANNSTGNVSSTNSGMRLIGLGVSMLNLPNHFQPVTNLLVTVNVTNGLRGEVELGFENMHSEDDGMETDSRMSLIALKGAAMWQMGNVNLYAGLRLGVSNSYYERINLNNPDNNSKDETSVFLVGPVAGGEYFLGSRFSLGGELAIDFYTGEEEEWNGNNKNTTDLSGQFIRSAVMMRFYF